MTREAQKGAYELDVFTAFLKRSGIKVDPNSIRSGKANLREPDLICKYVDGAEVGFELARLTDPNLAKVVNRWNPVNAEYVRTSDPSGGIARQKIEKTYGVAFPVDLLLYKEHPIITPDNVIIPTIEPVCHMTHKYSKVWFMGDSIKLLYERG